MLFFSEDSLALPNREKKVTVIPLVLLFTSQFVDTNTLIFAKLQTDKLVSSDRLSKITGIQLDGSYRTLGGGEKGVWFFLVVFFLSLLFFLSTSFH